MTPEEVLKLSKDEIYERKWSDELDNKGENSECSECSGCSDCSDCYMCRNAKGLKWAIANVEVGEEDYRAKMKELGVEI